MKGRFFLSLLIVLFATSAVAQTTSHRLQSSKHPDVSTSAPSNNQCLVYVAATGKWTPGSCSAGAGDVTKVGTPAQYYLGIWTGDGTLGSVAALGSAGNPLISGGAAANPSWLSIVLAGGTNTFSITNGTASLDVAAGATLNIDKSLQVATGAVVINGNAGGSSVLGLPNQTVNLTTMTNGKWCSYNSTGTALSCNEDAPAGSGDVTGVGDCAGGACLDGSSDGGTYISLYDGDSNKTTIYAGDSSSDLTFYFPTAAGAKGGMMYFSANNQLASLAHPGTANYVLTTNATDTVAWANTLNVSSITSGGIVLGDTTPDADGEIGYASNAYLWYANSEDWKITATTNLWTFDSNTSATFAFTPAVAFTGGIGSIGAASNLSGGTVTLGTLAGAIDAGGATSLEIPNGSNPTVDATGEVALDTTADQIVTYGASAVKVHDPRRTFSVVVPSVADTDDMLFVKLPFGITATSLDCIVSAATSATINIQECDSAGANCTDMATSDLACDTDGAATTTFNNAAADAGDWLKLDVASISGTPGTLTVTLTYIITRE